MENKKKEYEKPVITKVEFDAGDRITASSCYNPETMGIEIESCYSM